MNKPRTEPHCVTLRPEQWEALLGLVQEGGSVSALLRDAIDQYLARKAWPREKFGEVA